MQIFREDQRQQVVGHLAGLGSSQKSVLIMPLQKLWRGMELLGKRDFLPLTCNQSFLQESIMMQFTDLRGNEDRMIRADGQEADVEGFVVKD